MGTAVLVWDIESLETVPRRSDIKIISFIDDKLQRNISTVASGKYNVKGGPEKPEECGEALDRIRAFIQAKREELEALQVLKETIGMELNRIPTTLVDDKKQGKSTIPILQRYLVHGDHKRTNDMLNRIDKDLQKIQEKISQLESLQMSFQSMVGR